MSASSKRDTCRRIKEVALRLFLEKGYANVSLEEIASRVGVTKPAIYVYYRSKAELFNSVMKELFAGITALVDEALAIPADPVEKLVRLSHALVKRFSEIKKLYGASISEPLFRKKLFLKKWGRGKPKDAEFFVRLRDNFISRIEQLFSEGKAQGFFRKDFPDRFLARSFLALCATCVVEECTDPFVVSELILNGIAVRREKDA